MNHMTSALGCLLLLTTACGDTSDSNDDLSSLASVYALGTDGNGSGSLAKIGVPGTEGVMDITSNLVAGVAADDSIMRSFDGKLYIVNRFGSDNLTIVDTATAQLVAQISTGPGTNPQDVTRVGSKLYVCAFNSGDIIILDEDNPTAAPTTIDISSYDADGVPNCGSIVSAGDKVFASLGLLDADFASQGGKVLVIDPVTDTVESDIDLAYGNPFGLMATTEASSAFGGDIIVSTTDFSGTGGCVERISTGASPASLGCLAENSALGGFSTTLQVTGDSAWLAVSTSFTTAKLISVSADGTVGDTSLTPVDQHVTDFVVCPTQHIIANDRTTGTLRVFDLEGTEMNKAPLDIGLPPTYTNGLVCI